MTGNILTAPLLVPIQEDEEMDAILYHLEQIGFMPRSGFGQIYPYSAMRDEFFERTGTYPTYMLISDVGADFRADGRSIMMCGEEELSGLLNELAEPAIETTIDQLHRKMRSW